ncbi:DUF4112 domain-containing protein, partial [Patescibacteria group bacterium]|nr:DUF4112 domain-containing protein [Patescibacteria group bacterium]
QTHEISPEELEQMRANLKRIEGSVKRAEFVADMMDSKLLDPIIGAVFPEIGDAITALPAVYIMWEAKRAGMDKMDMARMIGRTAVDVVAGAVPVAGDAADVVYKSNEANAKALREYFEGKKADVISLEKNIRQQRGELKTRLEGDVAA